jgi:dUTP pyrophosphatase
VTNMLEIRFKKLHTDVESPIRATDGSNAFDLFCNGTDTRFSERSHICRTDIAVEIPEGYAGLLLARSSVSKRGLMLANGVGLIDSDYRGELLAKFNIVQDGFELYTIGERCCQLLIIPAPIVTLKEVDQLTDTARGRGGFGSTNQ